MNAALTTMAAIVSVVALVVAVIATIDGVVMRRPWRTAVGLVAIAAVIAALMAALWHERTDGTVCVGSRSACSEVVR